MLETDCMIPTQPVTIPIPDHITLYGIARSVRALQLEGLGKWGIIKKLHISEEAYKDAIFEINRAKAVDEMNDTAPKKRKRRKIMIENLKEKVRELKEQGMKNADIARELGISAGRVSQIVKELGIAPAQINADFDAAVDQMIAEIKPQEIAQTDKPVIMTEEHIAAIIAAIPDAVISAVEGKVADLQKEIQRNAEQAKSLLRHNDNYIKRIETLEKWLAEVRNESTAD